MDAAHQDRLAIRDIVETWTYARDAGGCHIQLNGTRAIAQTRMTNMQRGEVDGVRRSGARLAGEPVTR